MSVILKSLMVFVWLSCHPLLFAQERCMDKDTCSAVIPIGYNKYQTPLESVQQPTPVYVSLHVMDIDEIREENMEYSVQFYVNEIWNDSRLILDSFRSRTSDSPVLVPREVVPIIWTPDIIFENSKGGWIYPLSVPNTVVKVLRDGSLCRYTRYNMRVSCLMLLKNFPMDTQHCYLSISSLANDRTKMNLKWMDERSGHLVGKRSIFMADLQPLKYQVGKARARKRIEERLDGNYTTLIANFTLVRYVSSHIFNMYIPSALVVLLSHMTFWLDVNAVPARVALGLTSLLTLSTQASEARNGLPPVNYLTALDIWLFVCIFMVFSSLIEYAVVYHFYRKKVPPPRYKVNSEMENRNPFRAWSTTRSTDHSEKPPDISKLLERDARPQPTATLPEKKDDSADQLLDRISRFLFPSIFVLFTSSYWLYYIVNR